MQISTDPDSRKLSELSSLLLSCIEQSPVLRPHSYYSMRTLPFNTGLTVFLFWLQLHTSELNDGYDWGRLNLQSVTEQNNLEEFLATAELAGTEFTAGQLEHILCAILI